MTWLLVATRKEMFERVALILALLMTSAAADNYRSFRTAYASVDWLDSISSTEQCQKHILDIVVRFGFTDAEVKTSRWTGEPALWVKDKTHHFSIAFSCDLRKRIITIDVDGWKNQTGSAANLIDRLVNSFSVPLVQSGSTM